MYFLFYFNIFFFFSYLGITVTHKRFHFISLLQAYCYYIYCVSFWALFDGVYLPRNKKNITYLRTCSLTPNRTTGSTHWSRLLPQWARRVGLQVAMCPLFRL